MPKMVVVGSQPRVWELAPEVAPAVAKLLHGAGLPLEYGPNDKLFVNSPFVGKSVTMVLDNALGPASWARELEDWLAASGGRLDLHRHDRPGRLLPQLAAEGDGHAVPVLVVAPLIRGEPDADQARRLTLKVPLPLWLQPRGRQLMDNLTTVFRQQQWEVVVWPSLRLYGAGGNAVQLKVSVVGRALTQALFVALAHTLEGSRPMGPRPLPAADNDTLPVRLNHRLAVPAVAGGAGEAEPAAEDEAAGAVDEPVTEQPEPKEEPDDEGARGEDRGGRRRVTGRVVSRRHSRQAGGSQRSGQTGRRRITRRHQGRKPVTKRESAGKGAENKTMAQAARLAFNPPGAGQNGSRLTIRRAAPVHEGASVPRPEHGSDGDGDTATGGDHQQASKPGRAAAPPREGTAPRRRPFS